MDCPRYPPLIFIAETSPLVSGLASQVVLFHLVPARSFPGIREREGFKGGRRGRRHKDEHRGRERGFITGKPVSYANIVLQTLHYRWWAINTPAWSPCSAVLMHSECLSITRRRCPRSRAADRDWRSRSAFLLPFFSFSFPPCRFYAPLYYSTTVIPSLEQCPTYICNRTFREFNKFWCGLETGYISRDKRNRSIEISDSNEEKIRARNTRRRCTRSCNKVGVVGVIAQVPRYGKKGEKGTLAAAVARSKFNELKRGDDQPQDPSAISQQECILLKRRCGIDSPKMRGIARRTVLMLEECVSSRFGCENRNGEETRSALDTRWNRSELKVRRGYAARPPKTKKEGRKCRRRNEDVEARRSEGAAQRGDVDLVRPVPANALIVG